MNALPGQLEVHRHRNEPGTHDAEISGEIFRSVEGEDRDAVAAGQSAACERARDRVRAGVELCVGEFARALFSAEIDDGDLAQVEVAAHEVAKIAEARHYNPLRDSITRHSGAPKRSEGEPGIHNHRSEVLLSIPRILYSPWPSADGFAPE